MSTLRHALTATAARRYLLPGRLGSVLLVGSFIGFYRAWRGRAAVLDMRDYNDAQLADIGLKRADVENALKAPIGADPSHHLIRARLDPLRSRKRA